MNGAATSNSSRLTPQTGSTWNTIYGKHYNLTTRNTKKNMATKDNIFIGAEARDGIIKGIRRCATAVGGTMGTGGHNAILEVMENPGHMTTNDGATILDSIRFADPLEEMGRRILLEAVKRANKQSGDGSSTTTVLTAAIIEEGLTYLELENPMDIKRSLEECMAIIEAALTKQTRQITVDEVGKVATVSAEDEGIGKLIQEIYQQIGKDGIIHWDISKDFNDHYTIGKGITIHSAGFASPYMADLDEKTGQYMATARWQNAHILITKQKVTSASDFNSLFQGLFAKDIKEVVVFCDEYEANVIVDLIRTRAVRGFKTLLVKMPVYWKDQWYEDLAKATGATIIDPNAGTSFKTMTIEQLGIVDNIVVGKDDVYLDGIKDLSEHVTALEADGTDDSKLRASRLNTKTARYYVGAASDSALSYRRLKVEDAIGASWQALNGGIVAGGGSALASAIADLPETVGGQILFEALKAPARQIAANVGYDKMVIGADYADGRGLNSKTKTFVNMFDAGIVDPAPVVINAVRNAISVAASVLTAPVVIVLPKEEVSHVAVHQQ